MDNQPTTPIRPSYMTLDPPAPSPEKSPSSYTPEKIQNRLKFGERIKQSRDITPRCEIFAEMYIETAETALAIEDPDKRLFYCRQLYRYDNFIQMNGFLSMERSQEQRELEEKLLKLKRLEYFFRYGDYLAQRCKVLKNASAELGSKELENYWTNIIKKMETEQSVWDKLRTKARPQDISTLTAIWQAATAIRIDSDRAEWVIKQYAERNEMAHSRVLELLQIGHWTELALILYHDRKDLPLVIPPDMNDDIERMTELIDDLRDQYFIIEKGDEEEPHTWRPTEEAARFRAALRSKEEEKERKKAEHMELITKKARKEAQVDKRLDTAILGKRKASRSLNREQMAKKRKEMESVIGIQKEIERWEDKLERLYDKRDGMVDDLGKLELEGEGSGA